MIRISKKANNHISSNSLHRLLFTLGSICWTLFFVQNRAAWAGQWQLDHYEVTEDAYTESHHGVDVERIHGDDSEPPIPCPLHRVMSPNETVSLSSFLYYNPCNIDEDDTRPPFLSGGKTFCSLTVTPVFKWHADSPNDKPTPYLLLAEQGRVTAKFGHFKYEGSPYTQEQPYNGENFTLVSLSNGRETLAQNPEAFSAIHPLGGQPPYCTYNRYLDKTYITMLPTGGQSELRAPTRTVHGEITSGGWVGSNLGSEYRDGAYVTLTTYYSAKVAKATLTVRRVDSQVVTEQHPEGEPAPFASGTSIAAGFKKPAEHKAEVQLQFDPPIKDFDLTKLPNVKVIEVPSGVEHSGLFARRRSGVTDDNGRGIIGTFKSTDLVQNFTLSIPNLSYVVASGVGQKWATVEWKMGENGDKEWNPAFWITGQNSTEWLWTKVILDVPSPLPIPLEGHTLSFVLNHLEVKEEDPITHHFITKIFTTDPIEAVNNVPDPNRIVVYDTDISQYTGKYVTFSPASAVGSGDGIYKSQITVKHDPSFEVIKMSPALEDQGVFHL